MRVPRPLSRTAAQAYRRLPRAARVPLAVAASLVGQRPDLGLPAVGRALVVAPHPDDETIGAGGTIALLADAGCRVDVVVVTDGEATIGAVGSSAAIAGRRRAEVAASCSILGAGAPSFLHLPDGDVAAHGPTLREALREAIRANEPQLVLAPWPLDRHPDHVAVARALPGLQGPVGCELWSYEAHFPLPATRVVDVTDVIERKRAALAAHVTAAGAFDLSATLGLSRWRSLLTDAGHGWAEAFLACRLQDAGDVLAALDAVSAAADGHGLPSPRRAPPYGHPTTT